MLQRVAPHAVLILANTTFSRKVEVKIPADVPITLDLQVPDGSLATFPLCGHVSNGEKALTLRMPLARKRDWTATRGSAMSEVLSNRNEPTY